MSLLPLEKETQRRLDLLGIETLGELAALPADSVQMQFGKSGQLLHKLARGNDTRPILYRTPKPACSLKQHFEGAVENQATIAAILQSMGTEIARSISSQGYTTQCLELLLQLDNGKSVRQSQVLRESTNDGKLIGRGLVRRLAQIPVPCGVVSIEVKTRDLTPVTWIQLYD